MAFPFDYTSSFVLSRWTQRHMSNQCERIGITKDMHQEYLSSNLTCNDANKDTRNCYSKLLKIIG